MAWARTTHTTAVVGFVAAMAPASARADDALPLGRAPVSMVPARPSASLVPPPGNDGPLLTGLGAGAIVSGAVISAVGLGAYPACYDNDARCLGLHWGLFGAGIGVGAIGGGVLMGLGLRTWRRATAAPPGVDARKGSPTLMGLGAALAVLGGGLTGVGFGMSIWMACQPSKPSRCFFGLQPEGAVLFAAGSPLLAAGVPMIALGRHQVRDYGEQPSVSLSTAPLGIAGRF